MLQTFSKDYFVNDLSFSCLSNWPVYQFDGTRKQNLFLKMCHIWRYTRCSNLRVTNGYKLYEWALYCCCLWRRRVGCVCSTHVSFEFQIAIPESRCRWVLSRLDRKLAKELSSVQTQHINVPAASGHVTSSLVNCTLQITGFCGIRESCWLDHRKYHKMWRVF